MNARFVVSNLEVAGASGPPRCHVPVIYEDLGTGLRAKQVFEVVARQLDFAVDFDLTLWRFDLLSEPEWFSRATHAAQAADIVFLSAHGTGGLPAVVEEWLMSWLAERAAGPGLIAVSLDPEAWNLPATKRTLEALRGAARLAGVDVLLDESDLSSEHHNTTALP